MVQQPKAAKTPVLRKDNVFANVLRSRKKQRYVAACGKRGLESGDSCFSARITISPELAGLDSIAVFLILWLNWTNTFEKSFVG